MIVNGNVVAAPLTTNGKAGSLRNEYFWKEKKKKKNVHGDDDKQFEPSNMKHSLSVFTLLLHLLSILKI